MSILSLIIKREFIAKVRNKSFIVMTFLSPLLFVGIAVYAFDVLGQAGADVGIAPARVKQGALTEDVSGANRGIERVARIQRGVVRAMRPDAVARTEGKATFDAEH